MGLFGGENLEILSMRVAKQFMPTRSTFHNAKSLMNVLASNPDNLGKQKLFFLAATTSKLQYQRIFLTNVSFNNVPKVEANGYIKNSGDDKNPVGYYKIVAIINQNSLKIELDWLKKNIFNNTVFSVLVSAHDSSCLYVSRKLVQQRITGGVQSNTLSPNFTSINNNVEQIEKQVQKEYTDISKSQQLTPDQIDHKLNNPQQLFSGQVSFIETNKNTIQKTISVPGETPVNDHSLIDHKTINPSHNLSIIEESEIQNIEPAYSL